MRKYIPLALIILSILLTGCANTNIETTISDFEDAVNDDDASAIEDILSPESDFYITATFEAFLDYFDGNRPVNYSGLNIEVDGGDADVEADATYLDGAISDDVLFKMKREESFLAFLFGEWKVFRYYDSGDFDNPVWRKLQKKASQNK